MTTGLTGSPRNIDALTSIRFFFALLVVFGHLSAHLPTGLVNSYPALFGNAPFCVSWFFILSGFVIAYNYPALSDGFDRRSFLLARIARLWPVHIITLFAAVLIQGGGKYYPFFLTMTHTWTASPDMGGAYNGPSWSISDEFFFYVCYLGLAAPQRWVRFAVAVIPIAIAFALLFRLRCYLPAVTPGVPRQCGGLLTIWPPSRLVEFLAGIAIFRLGLRVPQIIGLALPVALFAGILPSLPVPGNNPIGGLIAFQATCIMTGGALIASLSRSGWLSRMLSVRPLVIGGEISYAMYMTHQVVNWALSPYLTELSGTATFAILVTVTILISAFLFYTVEAPVRDSVKRWLKSKQSPKLAATAEMSALPGPT